MNIPTALMHFCDAIWEYRISTNEVFFHHDTIDSHLCNTWIPYENIDKVYQDTYVYNLDIHIWQHYLTPEALRRFSQGVMPEDHFYIRLEIADQEMQWHEVYIQKIDSDHLLILSKDTREMQRNSIISKAVVPEVDFVCCIDLENKSYVLYYSDDNKTLVPKSASDNYEEAMEEFNRLYIIPEEAETLIKNMSLDNVLQELEQKSEYIIYATMNDKNNLSYKKLRFSYEDEQHKRLLLTRNDIGSLIGEKKLLEHEKTKRLEYLENMPVAFCSIKVLLDNTGNPYDFQFTYCNKALENLEGVESGELIGKNFYEFFQEGDRKLLKYYYETAYLKIPHIIKCYSGEKKKHLIIYTFFSELGSCECVLLDVSEQYFLTEELENRSNTMKQILKITTDQVFQYFPERDNIILNNDGTQQLMTMDELLNYLSENSMLHPDFFDKLKDGFTKVKNGEHTVSLIIKAKRLGETIWQWFQVTIFDFQEGYTHKRKVLGFLQNIDEFKTKEEKLRIKAEQDSLTGVLNAGSGKQKIAYTLSERLYNDETYQAFFLLDLDNFKAVNDNQGHIIGDKVLIKFSQILTNTFRSEDIIYRLGGDEFVVFVNQLYHPETYVQTMLNRLINHIEEAKSEFPYLSSSIGIFVTNKKYDFDEAYQKVDQVLYKAKRSGKGQTHIYIEHREIS